ncbi:response regulator transcription factor [Streptomyces ossamyceticus]|uniref:response regulator transcription factor n=1 Tax=Streptomyces ossamyceticus TaxID=249581 RepID=UPI0006E1C2A5|nr:response regulator transcription factor [Streptomyces ossamyceticus]
MTIRVLIADDQMMVREGFSVLLGAMPDIEVVGEAVNGRDAVYRVRELSPDVVLMDIRMPEMNGIEATREIVAADGGAKVLVLTTFDLDEYVYQALRAGASGFLLKDSGPTLLAEAVRAAAVGDSLVSPSVTVRLLKHVTAETERAAGAEAPRAREPLTDRELDVVKLVALGHTNAEIAASMFVSLSTVKTHLGSIQLKLAARNRVEIAAWAWRTGLAGDRS